MGSKTSDTELLTLILSWSPSNTVEGRTRLEKLVYLLKHVFGIPFTYNFFPYLYGPYSRDLMEDLDQLNEFGLVEEDMYSDESGIIRYDYLLTKEGIELAKHVENDLRKEDIGKLKRAYDKLKDRPTFELIAIAKSYMAEGGKARH